MIVEAAAFFTVLATATFLFLLGLGALVTPARIKRFLEGFAQSLRVHLSELAARLVAGVALVVSAPRLHFGAAFAILGWVLVGTTLVMAVVPWRMHRRFADWSVPHATRYMPLLGVAAVLAGCALLGALLLPRAAG